MRRWSGILLLTFGALLGLMGCADGPYRDLMFSAQSVNGQVYVVVQTESALPSPGEQGLFRIYRSTTPDFGAWQPLDENRTGPVYDTFVWKEKTGERLGLFHKQRISLWKFGEEKIDVETKLLPFKWNAGTAAQVDDQLFVFGGNRLEQGDTFTVRLTAARFDGKEFKELDPGPVFIKSGESERFSLQAVAHQKKVYVFWRSAEEGGVDLEPPLRFPGPLRMAVFDGSKFETEVHEIAGIPQGWVELWSDGTELRAVVQPQDGGTGQTPQLKLYRISTSGVAREDPMAPYQAPPRLHFKYFNVTRLPSEGRAFFLRSNSQQFELLESVAGTWRMLPQPVGLPQQQLMSLVLGLMVLCVSLVAMGVGMAIRRRRQVQLVLQRLRPQDVMAPLSLRISAYLVDLGVIVGLTQALCTLTNTAVPRWAEVFFVFKIEPAYAMAYLVYLVYLSFCEWRLGRTLGKWLLGLQVVTDQGDAPTLWGALVRNLVGFFERLLVLPAIVSILLTPRGQRLGDLLGRTLVVQRAAFERYREQRQQAEAEKSAREGTSSSAKAEAVSAATKPAPEDGEPKK